jgi:dethiobiotin synthase
MSQMESYFITGTDTDIGKTYISRILVDALSQFHPTTYMKPVQTGCTEDHKGNLHSPDYDFVMSGKATPCLDIANHLPYRFKKACSPHLAASLENSEISLDVVIAAYTRLSSYNMNIIVEGAGGVMVPLNSKQTMLDLIKTLDLPVILVSSPHLGTINHTLMSIEMLKSRSIRLAGVIINNVRNIQQDFIYHDNIDIIKKYISPRPLLEVGYNSIKDQDVHAFCRKIR